MEPGKTQWLAVGLLFFAGCTTALHNGKVPSALPLMREQWSLSLTQTGLIVSMHALFIACSGLLLGMLVRRIGYGRFAIGGVGLVGLGSIVGTQAESLSWMLATRTIEGFGWIVAVIALPPLLSSLSRPSDRSLVMGIWAGFVPLGAGAMLMIAPALQHAGGWQLSWWFAGVLSLMGGILAFFVVRGNKSSALESCPKQAYLPALTDLKQPVVWVFCLCFFAYSFQFMAVTSFMPTVFLETTSLSLTVASRIVALVIMSNIIGSVLAGLFLRRGLSPVWLLMMGALCAGSFAFLIFLSAAPPAVRLIAAFGFSACSGLIPGALFATLPKAASSAAATGLLIGLMMQFSGIGQLTGGIVLSATVDFFGYWEAAGVVCMLVGVAGCLLAWCTRSLTLSG